MFFYKKKYFKERKKSLTPQFKDKIIFNNQCRKNQFHTKERRNYSNNSYKYNCTSKSYGQGDSFISQKRGIVEHIDQLNLIMLLKITSDMYKNKLNHIFTIFCKKLTLYDVMEKVWSYKDPKGNIHGFFSSQQMDIW